MTLLPESHWPEPLVPESHKLIVNLHLNITALLCLPKAKLTLIITSSQHTKYFVSEATSARDIMHSVLVDSLLLVICFLCDFIM